MTGFEIFIIATISLGGGMTLIGLFNKAISKAETDTITKLAPLLREEFTTKVSQNTDFKILNDKITNLETKVKSHNHTKDEIVDL